MTAHTRPTAEQIVFKSPTTGEQNLHDYLEAVQIGGRTLPELMDSLIGGDGEPRAYEFRADNTGYLQYRVGTGSWLNLFDLDAATADATAQAVAAAASASSASTSAGTATTQANSATASKNAAATSETNALASRTAAATSETNAASSATAAASSASTASTAATNANASKDTAQTAATNASNSATNAANSSTSAGTSASTATTQATTATNARTAAETARDLAQNWATKTGSAVAGGEFSAKHHAQASASSATAAATSQTSAASSASAAATSATNSANSATSAATSATEAATTVGPRLGVEAQIIADWNDAQANGWYMADGALNAPTTGWFIANVENHGAAGWCTQTAHAFTAASSSDTMAYRRHRQNGPWGSWYRLRLSEIEQRSVIGKATFSLNTSTDDGVAQVTISSNRNGTTNPTTPNLRVQNFAPSIAFRDNSAGHETKDVHLIRDSNVLSVRWDTLGDGVLATPFSVDVSSGLASLSGQVRTAAGTASAPSHSFTTDTNSGLRSGGADIVSLVTGGVDRATVDANGHMYLGGGTSVSASGVKALSVKGPNSGGGYGVVSVECGLNTKTGVLQISGADGDVDIGTQVTNTTGDLRLMAGGAPRVTIQADGAIVPTANLLWTTTPGALHVGYTALTEHQAGNTGPLYFGINDGGGWTGMMVSNFRTGSLNSQDIYFRTATGGVSTATDRMQITSGGYVQIGQIATTTPGYGNTITGKSIWPTGRQFISQTEFSQWNMNADGSIVTFARSGAAVGSVTVSTTTTSYNTSSDHRLKTEVEPLTGALDRLALLEPKRFRWVATPDAPKVDGFIAHQAQAVCPEAVIGEHNGEDFGGNPVYQQIDQGKLVPLLVAALQELAADFAAYKASHP